MEKLLEKTGERMIEDKYRDTPEDYLIYLIHIVSYHFVIPHVGGKRVLDYGCGSGYGSHQVAKACGQICGVDIDPEAIRFASSRYSAPNLSYRHIQPSELSPLPFEDETFDVVISFQVIEHVKNTSEFLNDLHRVLKPGGVFFCATPNRATRLLPMQKPWNLWHVYEYNDSQLKRLLESRFKDVNILHIGGKKEVIDLEISRTRRLKWAALPFTLPFVPESFRIYALSKIRNLKTRKNVRSVKQPTKPFSFSESDLTIEKGAKPSVDLMAVCRK